jgi:TolB-like protein
VKSSDAQITQRLELELLQILTEEGFDVLTPNKVKQQLMAAQSSGQMAENTHLWADHLLLGEATTTGDRILVALRIINVSSGQTVAQIQSFAGNATQKSSLTANTMRGAVERLTDGLHFEIGQLPGATRYQRVAVMPLQENGAAAQNLTLGTYLQQEISGSLVERGYLSVERTRLNEAIAQMGLAQALNADHAPATGKMLGAQIIVTGSVSDTGDRFIIIGRALDARTGALLGSAKVDAKRENIVTLASGAIETRNAGGAAFRSAILPGWGQFYYQKPIRGMLWTVGTYSSALVALAAAGAGYQQHQVYLNFVPDDSTGAETQQTEITQQREQANNLYSTAAIAAGITAVIWTANILDAALLDASIE